jgi:uncharacterized protein (DUF2236 family)
VTLPLPLRQVVEMRLARLLWPGGAVNDDFLEPRGEPALIDADSVSWQVFRNPLAVFVGGVAAVVLELAEPRVRTGVWENTSFRERPMQRLQRTGYAAMLSVYGPRSRVLPMIAGVRRLHESLQGISADGRSFGASDPDLLEWVHATASFGFLEAHAAYVQPLSAAQRDRFYAEGVPLAQLYGCASVPASEREREALFARMSEQLETSTVIEQFLAIAARMPALPAPVRPLQRLLIRAAVAIVPAPMRDRVGLAEGWRLSPWQAVVVRRAAASLDRWRLRTNPAVQACTRLGLPDDHPWRGE